MPTASLMRTPNKGMGRLGMFLDSHRDSHLEKHLEKQHSTARTATFSEDGEHSDLPLLLPMRQLSKSSNMSCVMENSSSDLSTSARFGLAEHDEPIPGPPRRQLSKSYSNRSGASDLSSIKSYYSNDNDRQPFNQSLTSLCEDSIDGSVRSSVGIDDSSRSTKTGQSRLETILDSL